MMQATSTKLRKLHLQGPDWFAAAQLDSLKKR